MSKLKVLIVSHTYVVGINQQKIEALAKDSDLEIVLLTTSTWKAPLRDTELEKTADENYLIKSFPPYFSGSNDRFFFSPVRVYNLIRDFRPDIIHVEEEPWSLALLEFNIIGKLLGCKVVFFTWENIFRMHKPWYALIETINLKLSNGAIAGNSEAKEILLKRSFGKDVIVLPQLGVDLGTFKKIPQDKLKKELKLRSTVIGTFARLEEQKGIKTLLEAFNKLKNPNVSLLLVGSGPMLDHIKELAKGDSRIVAPGVVNHADIPAYLNLVDIFVLPSETTPVWKEQFGHVLIEAMATGVPLIGSSSGAIPEVVGDGGILFKEGDSSDLYKQIKKLLEDKKLYQELQKKGLARVGENFTQEKIGERTSLFYRQIVSQSGN